jgi:anti-sigma factor RsiW
VYRDALNCEVVRETLWPLEQPRAYSEEDEAARMHLGHCAECREFFARDAALVRAVSTYGTGARAPERLRKRVREAIAREARLEAPTRLPSRVRREGAAIAAAVVVLLAAGAIVRTSASGDIREAYAQDYLNRAVQDHAIHSPDPAAVLRFFLQEMGVGVLPVTLVEGRMTRAMVCLLADRQAAMVEYAIGEHTIAHYRVPTREAPVGETEFRSSSERGISIVSWRDGVFEHALVGDLPPQTLTALARRAFSSIGEPSSPTE